MLPLHRWLDTQHDIQTDILLLYYKDKTAVLPLHRWLDTQHDKITTITDEWFNIEPCSHSIYLSIYTYEGGTVSIYLSIYNIYMREGIGRDMGDNVILVSIYISPPPPPLTVAQML